MQEVCSKIVEEADALEESINEKMGKDFGALEKRIYCLIGRLNRKIDNPDEGESLESLIKKAQEEISKDKVYKIKKTEKTDTLAEMYKLEISGVRIKRKSGIGKISDDASKVEFIAGEMEEYVARNQESMTAAQEKLAEICKELRSKAEKLEKYINKKMSQPFAREDARLQEVVGMIKKKIGCATPKELEGLAARARATLAGSQRYAYTRETKVVNGHQRDMHDLAVTREVLLEYINFAERKAPAIRSAAVENGKISFSFTFFSPDEVEGVKSFGLTVDVVVTMWKRGQKEGGARTISIPYTFGKDDRISFDNVFASSSMYCMTMKLVHSGTSTEESDITGVATPEFKECCVWRKCPDDTDDNKKYSVDPKNPRIATMIGNDKGQCKITGNTILPHNKTTSWNIKALRINDNGDGFFIGVASLDRNQEITHTYGCTFICIDSAFLPEYTQVKIGSTYDSPKFIQTGDSVGVVMDTAKGELSFVLDGVNLGVEYEGIPIDKPLVPFVILRNKRDSVELDFSEVKETAVDSSIPVPTNITADATAWDTITIKWDAVKGASFYQTEVDGGKPEIPSSRRVFTKRGLLPETEHTFRVRTVVDDSVSEWSDAVRGRTPKQSFEECVWKECPDVVYKSCEYTVDKKNSRIASKTNTGGCCTIIGNTPLLPNSITLWTIKILQSRSNDGAGINIGVAPFDINQNDDGEYLCSCGWYFNCYNSILWSGPPHNYDCKEYGSIKEEGGQYVHTGDFVGVVMDTENGELFFVVNEENLGVAYEGIPLDKPLVPCVLLYEADDSVELII